MGVKWLLRWRGKGSSPLASDLDTLQTALESLNAKKDKDGAVWTARFQYFRQKGAGPERTTTTKDVCVVHFVDVPEAAYMLLIKEKQVLEAHIAMLSILEQKLDYKLLALMKFEGRRYRLGDFNIKLATVTQTGSSNSNLLGHVLEVEYVPIMHLDEASAVITDFLDLLRATLPNPELGQLQLYPNPSEGYQLSSMYGPHHTAVQYAEFGLYMLKRSQAR